MVVEQNKLECLSRAKSFKAILLVLFENFRLAWKKLDGTNTLAYLPPAAVIQFSRTLYTPKV